MAPDKQAAQYAVSLEDVQAAAARIAPFAQRTPVRVLLRVLTVTFALRSACLSTSYSGLVLSSAPVLNSSVNRCA